MRKAIFTFKKKALMYVNKKLLDHSKTDRHIFFPDLIDMRIPIDICRPVFTHKLLNKRQRSTTAWDTEQY